MATAAIEATKPTPAPPKAKAAKGAPQYPRRMDVAGASDHIDTSTLGGRMAWARLRKSMTQKELARLSKKSRATIVQYENDEITPPLAAVATIADKLGISPSYIAYGENVVTGVESREVEMVSFPEFSMGKDGSFASSVFAFAKSYIDTLGVAPGDIAAYVLNREAPAFDMHVGDRLIVDKSMTKPSPDRDMYLLQSPAGLEVVRVEPDLTGRAKTLVMQGSKGQRMTAKISDITILGAIVSSIRVS